MDTITLCFFCFVCLIIWRWRKGVFSAFVGTNIPGPPPRSWLWGSLQEYWIPTTSDFICKAVQQYGDTFGFYLGDHPMVFTKDLNLIRNVLIKDFNNFDEKGLHLFMHGIHPRLNGSLIFSGGERWKATRTCMSHAFSTSKLKMMMPALSHSTDLFLETVRELAEKDQQVDISETFADLTFDVIGKGAFGITTDAQRNRGHPIFALSLRAHPAIMSGFAYNLFQSFSSLGSLLIPLVMLHDWMSGNPFTLLADQIKPVIKKRKEDPSLRRPDMLQHLIEAETSEEAPKNESTENSEEESTTGNIPSSKAKHLSPNEVAVNSTFVFLGGYETTRLTLSYWSFYMAKYPDIQEKMRKEVMDAVGPRGEITYQVVCGLQYSEQVIKEVLRMSPPVSTFSTRLAKRDYHYKNMIIKKGMSITTATHLIQSDPHIWHDPDVFDPERFSPESKKRLAFLAFGAGPRQCVGMRLAMLETVYIAARILQRFQLELGQLQKPTLEYVTYAMMMGPKDGIWIKFHQLANDQSLI
ncbi:cytochrome P450 3A43-like [Ornithodoros turicata]|uniref:cytochrome P450 3A43-like n=1 Tax=Ornithodoros turicata TaxID=34597 RepID=UPI00313A46DF